MNIDPGGISFENTANAFEYKTDRELKKAEFLFSSMGYNSLVKLGTRLTPWMIRSGLPVKGLIRDTIFAQFVGGETLEETAGVARKLGEYHVRVILDYGVEGGEDGEAGFEHSCSEFIRVIEYAATQPNIPFISIKVTGFARFSLLERLDAAMDRVEGPLMKRYLQAMEGLTPGEAAEWEAVRSRMGRICSTAAERKIGVLVDADELRRISAEFAERMAAMEQDIHRLAGRPFNLGSAKQLGEILFDEMGLAGGRRMQTGAWGTDASVLQALAEQGHDLPARVRDWRQLAKLKSTYTDTLLEQINPATGRVHPPAACAARANRGRR